MEKLSKNTTFFQKLKKIFFPFYKSKDIKKLFSIIEKGKEKETQVAMFVGGCVRKFLTNQDIDDIDIASIFSPEELKEKFKNSEFRIKYPRGELGQSSGEAELFMLVEHMSGQLEKMESLLIQ